MNCLICKSELEKKERWDGCVAFSCPICKQGKIVGTIPQREKSLPVNGRAFFLSNGLGFTLGRDERYPGIPHIKQKNRVKSFNYAPT